MAYEVKENTATLFKNDRRGNDRAPSYRGKGLINGQEVEVSLWQKETKDKKVYLSLSFQKPYSQRKQEQPTKVEQAPQQGYEDLDGEIPF